jgi:hypothetical protein
MQRGLNTKRITIVFSLGPRNLSHHMIRQARIGDTVLVKRRDPNTAVVAGGWKGVKTTKK